MNAPCLVTPTEPGAKRDSLADIRPSTRNSFGLNRAPAVVVL